MFSSAGWLLAGNLAYAIFLWLTFVSIAKLGTPEMMGAYTYGFAVTTPVFMLFNLRLRFVHLSDNDEIKFKDYLSIRVITTILSIFIIYLICAWLKLEINIFIVIMAIAFAKAFESVSDIYYGHFQKCKKIEKIAISQFFKGSVTFICFVLLLHTFDSLQIACISMVIIWALVLLLFDSREHDQENKNVFVANKKLESLKYINFLVIQKKVSDLCKIILKALPLGVMGFLASLSINIPRYVIESNLSLADLGYYSAVTHIMLGGVMAISAIGQATIPKLSQLSSEKNIHGFVKLLKKLLYLSLIAGIVGWLVVYVFGEEILIILYGKEYAPYITHLQLIMIAAALNYFAVCFWYALTAMQEYWSQFYLFVVDVCIIYVLSTILIERIGLIGAIYSVIAVMIFHFIAAGAMVTLKIAKSAKV